MATADYIGNITRGDNVEVMRLFDAESIDLTVTSPPYDNLRTYNGYSFDFESVALDLYRITKPGGVVVWVVNDATVKGTETGSSFRQALYFKQVGFNLHDTMIYAKENPMPVRSNRYQPSFEFMFVFSKGSPATFNPLMDECKRAGKINLLQQRRDGGILVNGDHYGKEVVRSRKPRHNVWSYACGGSVASEKCAFDHPAIFPEKLAADHILSWSNPGDIVFDPFGGSGTTAKMAVMNGRRFIHVDISDEYCDIARKRIVNA